MIASRGAWFTIAACIVVVLSLLDEGDSTLVPALKPGDTGFARHAESTSVRQRRRRRPRLGGLGDDEEENEEFIDEDGDGVNDIEEDTFQFDCFPASASVSLGNGSSVAMRDLAVGDRVQVSVDGDVSEVFMFTHAIPAGIFSFVRLQTEDNFSVSLSPGHFVYASGELKQASNVRTGDVLHISKNGGEFSKVVAVSLVEDEGLYNPQTLHGDIIVDGVLASTYTVAVSPSIAHGVLAPARLFFSTFGMNLFGNSLDQGAPSWLHSSLHFVSHRTRQL